MTLVSNYCITFDLKSLIHKIIIDNIEIDFDVYYFDLEKKLTINVMMIFQNLHTIKVLTYDYDIKGNIQYGEKYFSIKNDKYCSKYNIEFIDLK